MTSFAHKICPYCGKEFTEQDDVVFCPDCGTPHHRACWVAHGACARASLHGQPQVQPEPETQTRPEPEQPSGAGRAADAAKICPRCGYRNQTNAAFCSGCGQPFQPAAGNPFGGGQQQGFDPSMFDPSINFSNGADFEDVPAADVTRLIGKNTAYYLPVFARMRAGGSGRFHFCALLFGGGWMLFRKQYKRGAIILAIQAVLRAVQFYALYALYAPMYLAMLTAAGIDINSITPLTSEQTLALTQQMMQLAPGDLFKLLLPVLVGLVGLIFSIVIGARANRWYYKDVLLQARKIRSAGGGEDAVSEAQTRRGGVNLPLGLCLLVCAMILYYFSDYIAAFLIR